MDPATLALLYTGYKGIEVGVSIFNIFSARNQSALYGHRIHREKQMSKLNAAQTVNIIMNSSSMTSYQQITADLNTDGNIDIFDVILMINLVLN